MRTLKLDGVAAPIPLGNIFCLGSNYAEHVREMRSSETPVIFLKPSSALVEDGGPIVRPLISRLLHHEVELVIAIGREGKNIPSDRAYEHILGYAVGLDMTLRDLQQEAKKKGHPWSVAKGFDTSASVSEIIPAGRISDPHSLTICCTVNGTVRQQSSTGRMTLRIENIIEYVSSIFSLGVGDLIFTGTPEGVGEVREGDILEAELVGFAKIAHHIQLAS